MVPQQSRRRGMGRQRRSQQAMVSVAAVGVAVVTGFLAVAAWSAPLVPPRTATSLRGGSGKRSPGVARWAAKAAAGLPQEKSDVFVRCIDEYDPNVPHDDFNEGPPPTGFRNMTEAIRPYHPNPEWMIFPSPGFERDQKVCSMYTLATGLFKEINKAIREDNEDSLRRHAPVIYDLRQVLRFKVDTICKPEGRKCRPFIGNVSRGLTVPVEQAEALANLYQVGTEFVWPAFTSCQLEEGGLWPFDGNVNFEIECNIDPAKLNVDEVYAPVRISRFLQGSNEVLFPPMTKFRVIGEREPQRVTENEETKDVYTKILEVVELPVPPKK